METNIRAVGVLDASSSSFTTLLRSSNSKLLLQSSASMTFFMPEYTCSLLAIQIMDTLNAYDVLQTLWHIPIVTSGAG